jgi:hypothetical protein
MTAIIETNDQATMKRTAQWVLRARRAAAEAAEDLKRAEDAFEERATATGIHKVDTDDAAVTLVFSHRNAYSVDVLERRLPEATFLEVTKRVVNTKPYKSYVDSGLIPAEVAAAATIRTESTYVKVDVH